MSSNHVVVVDYGAGNLLSVLRALDKCEASVELASTPEAVQAADRLILPGVGSFGHAMGELSRRNLVEPLVEKARAGTPFLGICLGMQMLFDDSDEFRLTAGLGLIPGAVRPVPDRDVGGDTQVVPHIGWGSLVPAPDVDWSESLLADTKSGSAVYFVHSFAARPADPRDALAHCMYGGHALVAVAGRDNVVGTQFHPEKSGEVGLTMLRSFLRN